MDNFLTDFPTVLRNIISEYSDFWKVGQQIEMVNKDAHDVAIIMKIDITRDDSIILHIQNSKNVNFILSPMNYNIMISGGFYTYIHSEYTPCHSSPNMLFVDLTELWMPENIIRNYHYGFEICASLSEYDANLAQSFYEFNHPY